MEIGEYLIMFCTLKKKNISDEVSYMCVCICASPAHPARRIPIHSFMHHHYLDVAFGGGRGGGTEGWSSFGDGNTAAWYVQDNVESPVCFLGGSQSSPASSFHHLFLHNIINYKHHR